METGAIKEVIGRIESWPKSRQEDVARVLLEMEAQDTSSYRLSDAQVAEVRRRLSDPNPTFVTLQEVSQRFTHRTA